MGESLKYHVWAKSLRIVACVVHFIDRATEWLIDFLLDWWLNQLTDWLIDWLRDSLHVCLMDWLIDWLIHWSTARLIDWFSFSFSTLLNLSSSQFLWPAYRVQQIPPLDTHTCPTPPPPWLLQALNQNVSSPDVGSLLELWWLCFRFFYWHFSGFMVRLRIKKLKLYFWKCIFFKFFVVEITTEIYPVSVDNSVPWYFAVRTTYRESDPSSGGGPQRHHSSSHAGRKAATASSSTQPTIKSELSTLIREIHNSVFEEHKLHPVPVWTKRPTAITPALITETCYVDVKRSVPTCADLVDAHGIDPKVIPEMSPEEVAQMIVKLFGDNREDLSAIFANEVRLFYVTFHFLAQPFLWNFISKNMTWLFYFCIQFC